MSCLTLTNLLTVPPAPAFDHECLAICHDILLCHEPHPIHCHHQGLEASFIPTSLTNSFAFDQLSTWTCSARTPVNQCILVCAETASATSTSQQTKLGPDNLSVESQCNQQKQTQTHSKTPCNSCKHGAK